MNIASMLIVIPYITSNKEIYGIYSICISTAMFLQYADLGFVSAGIKYAGELFARGDHEYEIRLYGFSSFILLIFITFIAAIFIYFSYFPSVLISGIEDSPYHAIASQLLFIQAIFSFSIILQRFITGICQVRIEQYIFQRINIVGSIIKIVFISYFFGKDGYNIVGYFLFLKIIETTALLVGLTVVKYRYSISILGYLRSIKFDKEIYRKTSELAFTSLFVTLVWILYYELDVIAVGKIFGASAAAVFALAFTFMKFLRSLSGVIFSPFQNRYNHFLGVNDLEGLKSILEKVIRFSMPLFIMPILSIIVLSEKIIFTWAGSDYSDSVLILILLAINFMYSFIVIPGSNILRALVRLREMYVVNITMTAVFWLGIYFTNQFIGVYSFPLFKLIAGSIAMIFYLHFILSFLDMTLIKFFRTTVLNLLFPILVQVLFLILAIEYLPQTKGKINLLLVVGVGGIATIIGFLSLYFSSRYYKSNINYYYVKMFARS
jgi:O-antigen/teichoic acid export membrane protein